MTNREKYKKAFDVLASSETISLEVTKLKKRKKKKYYGQRLAVAASTIFLLATTGTCAYAAIKHWGILDFTERTSMNVPEEAIVQIQTDVDTIQEHNGTIFNCEVKEALCDSQSITVVYEVSAKESDKYLFIPEDALPDDLMSNWSNISDITAREYADQKGLTIVNIGGGIMNRDELGIAVATMDFLYVRDDVLDIFVTCGKTEEGKTMDIDVMATARFAENDEVMRLNTSFTLQDMSTTTSGTYLPSSEKMSEQFFHIKNAMVLQTDLGTYVDVYYTNEKASDPDDGLSFRVVDSEGNEYTSTGNSGVEATDAEYRQRCLLNKCDIGDTLYIEAYDCFDKNVYGTAELIIE